MHGNNAEPAIILGERLTWGLEHNVYQRNGTIYKRPNIIGKIWQPMIAEVVEQDLAIFREFEIPIVPTILHANPIVVLPNGKPRRVPYLMEQPLVPNAVQVTVADMKRDLNTLDQVHEIALKSEALTAKYPSRGVDFLGGANWIDSVKSLSPFNKSFQGVMRNLFILQKDLFATKNMGSTVRQGDILGKKGDVLLCDVRLFNSGKERNIFGKLKGLIAATSTHIEYGAIWDLLEYLEVEKYEQPRSIRRLIGRVLAAHAIPKIEKFIKHSLKE